MGRSVKKAMSIFLNTVLALALSAAPPAPGAWLDDAATQILARAMVDEAKARTGSADARPNRQDLERALARCLDDVDNLMLLSGLMPLSREPEPLHRARPRVISSRDPSTPSDEL